MLAHGFRKPLSVISNSLELMNYSNEVEKSGPLEMAIRQTNVIGRLLDDLLDISRFADNWSNLDFKCLLVCRHCKRCRCLSPRLAPEAASLDQHHRG
jgi:hypothetical protein